MLNRTLCITLSALLAWGGLAAPAAAAVIGTDQLLAQQDRHARIAGIQASLARDDVRDALVELGVDPVEAQARVHALTDAELAQLEGQLETLPAGGSALALIGAVFLVLLILEVTGAINIFHGGP